MKEKIAWAVVDKDANELAHYYSLWQIFRTKSGATANKRASNDKHKHKIIKVRITELDERKLEEFRMQKLMVKRMKNYKY